MNCKKNIEMELAFSCQDGTDDVWLKALAERINELVLNDFHKLVSILYRLDVDETKLREELRRSEEGGQAGDAGVVIARLMIDRQLQKLRSRQEYRQDHEIDENEKW